MWFDESKPRLIKSSLRVAQGAWSNTFEAQTCTQAHRLKHSSPYWVAPAVCGSVLRARWWPWSCPCQLLSAGLAVAPARPAAAGHPSPARPPGLPIPPPGFPDAVAAHASLAPGAALCWQEEEVIMFKTLNFKHKYQKRLLGVWQWQILVVVWTEKVNLSWANTLEYWWLKSKQKKVETGNTSWIHWTDMTLAIGVTVQIIRCFFFLQLAVDRCALHHQQLPAVMVLGSSNHKNEVIDSKQNNIKHCQKNETTSMIRRC